MREELDKGNKILYHMKGHYAMLKGYIETDINGKKSYEYIFNDPEGNRYKGGYNEKSNGENAVYSQSQLKNIGIKGRSWVIEENK